MYSAAPFTNRTLLLPVLLLVEERVVTPLAVLLLGCNAQAMTLIDFLLRSNSKVAILSHLLCIPKQVITVRPCKMQHYVQYEACSMHGH